MSPVKIKKVNGYRVSTPSGVKAKRTTAVKAQRQARLLRGVEHGWRPTGRPARPTRPTRPSRPARRKRK